MTDRERAVVMAYTGVAMLAGDKLGIFYKYVEEKIGRPVWTHEMADRMFWRELAVRAKTDFLSLCSGGSRERV